MAGRPKIEIDFKELDKLCALQCTQEEIADWFDVSEETIEARIKETYGVNFPEYYRQKKGRGKVSLRRRQWQSAMDGNTALLIFLGKNYLGQADKQELTGADGGSIAINIDKQDDSL